MAFFKKFLSKRSNELLILYGTKSGNAKLVAQQTQKYFEKNGVVSICKNMSGFNPNKLTETQKLLIVVSTHGEGEPPPTAEQFFKTLLSDNMAPLHRLRYSICALGDSSYQEFCWAGKVLDHRFAELGAKAFYPRIDCDTEFSDDAVQWIKQSASVLISKPISGNQEVLIEPYFETTKSYCAQITQRIALTNGAEVASVFHLVLQIDPTLVRYHIGDSIEIIPENPEWLVDAISKELEFNELSINDIALLKKKLATEYEITSLSNKTVHDYATISKCAELSSLIKIQKQLDRFLAKANVLDLLTNYPAKINIEVFLGLLPKLKSRKYSIASSQKLMQNELHLTIKTIRYDYQGFKHEGSASLYANEYLPLHSNVSFKICPNESFQLPHNTNTPIIMIGVSTGIAPFRAMLQEREAKQVYGNTWLIWGNKYEAHDFLYQNELLRYKASGILEKLDTSFSCNNGETRYVHEILLSKSNDMLYWLTKGAHIYVCGSISMGSSVKKAFDGLNESPNYPTINLNQEGRWHEDLY
jgi:sulfite reductase (NADPH) flavoprotein alpha-component